MDKNYPSYLDRINSLYNTGKDVLKDIAKGNNIFVTDEIQQKRFDICRTCKFYDEEKNVCVKCGCNLAHKTKIKATFCPVKKWDKE